MNFVLYSSPARTFCARLDLLLFRPWNPKLSNVRFFMYIYSFLVLERFPNKIHFFLSFSRVIFLPKRLSSSNLSHLFWQLTSGITAYNRFERPADTLLIQCAPQLLPPYLYQSTSRSNLICISFFLKTLSQVYFSWTLCMCNFIFLFSYRYLIWYDHLWLLLSVVSLNLSHTTTLLVHDVYQPIPILPFSVLA